MQQLTKYRPKGKLATIKKVRVGQCIIGNDGSITKTKKDRCFLLTDEWGQIRLISTRDLKAYLLMCGSEIDRYRDLPLNNSVKVKANEDYFVLVYFASSRETINVRVYNGITKTVVAEEGDAIVYNVGNDGRPDKNSLKCIKRAEFLTHYEMV